MSKVLYRATRGLDEIASCAGRTLREAWYYASGLKRLENRYGSAELPDGVGVGAAMGLLGAFAAAVPGASLLFLGAAGGETEMVEAGIAALVYGGGGGLAVSFGVVSAYSHWKAGQHDYRLEQKEQCMALTGPSAQRPLLLK